MLKKLLNQIAAAAVIGLLLSAVSFAASVTMLDRVLAVVDDDIITLGEFESSLKVMRGKLAAAGETIPAESILKEKVLEQLVFEKLLEVHAKNTGVNVTDAMLEQAMGRLAAQNNMTEAQILQQLAKDGVSEEEFKSQMRNQLLVQRVIERDVKRKVTVLESEIDGILKNIQKQQPGRMYNLSHIMLSLDENAGEIELEKTRLRSERLRQRILQGKMSFADAAISSSSAPGSDEGGSMGWKTKDQLPSLFADAIGGLQQGDISEPLISPSGIHLIRVNEIKGSKQQMVKQTRARHILLKASNNVDIQHAISEMKKIRQRILAGEDFAELAMKTSQDSGSAIKGGELGWLNKGDTVPGFENAMEALDDGAISDPVVSQFGVHLIQLQERRMLDVSEEKRRDSIRQQIGKRKVAEKYDQFLKQLKSAAFIEYRVPIDEL